MSRWSAFENYGRHVEAVADEYLLHGADFPASAVREILYRQGLGVLMVADLSLFSELFDHLFSSADEARTFLAQLGRVRQILDEDEQKEDLNECYPGMLGGLETFEQWLREGIAYESYRLENSEEGLADFGWEVDSRDHRIKAIQTPGAGNRPRDFLNELICQLYDCLRVSFDVAWPKLINTKNPQPMRDHISALLAPLFKIKYIDPGPNGPVYNAIHNHTK